MCNTPMEMLLNLARDHLWTSRSIRPTERRALCLDH